MADYANEIRAMREQIKRLEDWKELALSVEREWNANAIATMLGGKPGESQRRVIQREVPNLLARIKRLEEAIDTAISFCEFHGPVGATPDTAYLIAKNLRKAKEAKP